MDAICITTFDFQISGPGRTSAQNYRVVVSPDGMYVGVHANMCIRNKYLQPGGFGEP
jgi:hypothetical protein